MPIDKPRPFVAHPDLAARNLAPGEGSNPDKRVDGALFDANNADLNNALAVRQGWGTDLVDAGSTAEQAVLTTPAGLFDAEHYIVAADGVRVWLTKMHADDELRLDDASIVNGAAGPADYAAAAFIESLHIWSVASEKAALWLDRRWIVRDPEAPEALTGADIARAPGVVDSLDDDLESLEDALTNEHAADGAHDGGFLQNVHLNAEEVFSGEGFVNLVDDGDFARWPQGPHSAPHTEGWWEFNAAVEREEVNVRFGGYAAKVTTASGNQGMRYIIDNHTDYRGRTLSVFAWIKRASPGSVEVRLEDGSGVTTGESVALSSDWQRVRVQRTIAEDADKLEIYIVSAPGTSPVFYLDGVTAHLGRVYKSYAKSVRDIASLNDVVPINWLINGSFEQWPENAAGGSGWPLAWEQHGMGFTGYNRISLGAFHGKHALALAAATACGAGCGVVQKIGGISLVSSKLNNAGPLTFSVWVKGDGAQNTWRLAIYDGTSEYAVDFEAAELSTDLFTQLSVTAEPSGSTIDCRIYAVDGEDSGDALIIDGSCLNIGSRPYRGAGYAEGPTVWRRESYDFREAGGLGGIVGLRAPVTTAFHPFVLDVYAATAAVDGPGGGTGYTDFTLERGSRGATPAPCNLTARLAAGDRSVVGVNTVAEAQSDALDDNEVIQIDTAAVDIGTVCQDVRVRLMGYSLVN